MFLPITGAIQTVSMRGTWEMLPLAHVQHVFDTVRPHYAAQLFLDTGLGFNETQTMVMPVQGQEREIEFDLSAYRDLKTLRFDPLNDLTVLHLNSVQFMTDGSVLPVDDYQTNACYQKGNNLLFDTPDPNITFAAPVEQAQKVHLLRIYCPGAGRVSLSSSREKPAVYRAGAGVAGQRYRISAAGAGVAGQRYRISAAGAGVTE